jgi:preprotein translocase subunit YajC
VFFLFHKFGFIPNKNTRDTVLVSAMAGISLVALGGVVLFFMTRPRRKTSQKP